MNNYDKIKKEFPKIKDKLHNAGNDKALVSSIAEKYIKKIEKLMKDPLCTDIEEQIYRQIIRGIKTYVIEKAWGKGDIDTGSTEAQLDIGEREEDIGSAEEGAGVLQANTNGKAVEDIRDVISYADQKNTGPIDQNELDIPADLRYTPPYDSPYETNPYSEDSCVSNPSDAFSFDDFMLSPVDRVSQDYEAKDSLEPEPQEEQKEKRTGGVKFKKEEEPDLVGLMEQLIEELEET